MGCGGSKNSAAAKGQEKPESQPATWPGLDKTPESGKTKVEGNASATTIFDSVGGVAVINAEILKMSVEELQAFIDKMPEHVRTKVANAVITASREQEPSPKVAFATEEVVEVVTEAPGAENPQEVQRQEATTELSCESQPPIVKLHALGEPMQQEAWCLEEVPVTSVATAADIEVLPTAAGKKTGGYWNWNCGNCNSSEAQSEIVMGQDM